MTCQNSHIWCIITWKSRFYHHTPKTLIFDALIRRKAGFLMKRPKTKCTFDALIRKKACFLMTQPKKKNAYLMHYYFSKHVFSWRVKTLIFDALLLGKAGFPMTRPKTKCIFDALLRFVAGFLMTHQKLLYLMHYYVEKQVYSWRAKKMRI